ncbi:MAG TPA: DNA/RNA non-specific endonuclease [Prolixibacteraceae bacterium]|nr:DNA/RNA non-specific endonuclease [Prolixibacteraceae bacterium]
MDRLEKLKLDQYAIADNAAKVYKERNKDKDPGIQKAIIEREKLYSLREKNRDKRAINALATERIILGRDESREFPPNDNAKKCGIPVARIYDIGVETEPKGFGTGFLIAPQILITNHHVFKNASETDNCAANFLYEKKPHSNFISEGISFKLRADIFFYTCEDLDFTLVYADNEPLSGDLTLNLIKPLRLIVTKGKVKDNSPINIIQYPMGGIKKYTTEENFITDIDDKLGILYYTTDTEPGSSGSPCFNKYWEVSALHYTAVPMTNNDGQWLTKNGEVWNENTMSEDEIFWIANAGKSISKIIEHLKNGIFDDTQKPYIDSILNNSVDPLKISPELKPETIIQTKDNHTGRANIVMNFNGNTTVYMNQGKSENESVEILEADKEKFFLEKKERFDENYDNRKGYDENFIPNFRVPFPKVSVEREKELYKNFGSTIPYVVPYIHFSLVMNKKRRMLMWAASNVDYSETFRDSRARTELGNGSWRLDKRIPAKYQIQADDFYDPATLVDKGHIVRRDDNCWAFPKNRETDHLGIEYANADTFHWTNCTPQHQAFNRDTGQYKGIGLWGVLENAIKEQLEYPKNDPNNPNKDYGQRACILAGPILNDNDPEYMEIQYPIKFWKVFAIHSQSEGNLVYGFILSQEDKVVEEGLEKEMRPRFNAKVKAMQVSLKEIERQSGVLFDNVLHKYDVFEEDDVAMVELDSKLENFKRRKVRTIKDFSEN